MKIALCGPADIHALGSFRGEDCSSVAPGLGGTATTPLIIEFLRRGHEVTLYTLSKGISSGKEYRWANLRIAVGPFRERHLAATYYGPEIEFLQRAIEADAPAFVHAHWTYEFALGALRSGTPTVTTIHDLPWNVFRYFRDPHRAVRLLMAYEVALRAKQLTAVSGSAAIHFARYMKRGAEIEVIYNGLPAEVFAMGRGPCAGPYRELTFATVLEGWSRRKNAKIALQAFDSVRRRIPGVRLLMFGCDYEQGGRAHRWAEKRGLEGKVSFVGPLPHDDLLRRVWHEVDIVVHPSLDEAFSMAALEAMALRKALIAGIATPGMEEMLESGAGVLVDMRNPSALAEAMHQLAINEDYRRFFADGGFERAFRLYRLSAAADGYEAVYARIMGSERSKSRGQRLGFTPGTAAVEASLDHALDGLGR